MAYYYPDDYPDDRIIGIDYYQPSYPLRLSAATRQLTASSDTPDPAYVGWSGDPYYQNILATICFYPQSVVTINAIAISRSVVIPSHQIRVKTRPDVGPIARSVGVGLAAIGAGFAQVVPIDRSAVLPLPPLCGMRASVSISSAISLLTSMGIALIRAERAPIGMAAIFPKHLFWAYSLGLLGDEGLKKDFELAVLAVFDRALTDFEISAMMNDYPID